MAILNFSDVLRKVGIDPAKVKLIRHPVSNEHFKSYYDKGMVREYTRHQKKEFSKGYDYWCVFIGDQGRLAKFFACYKVGGSIPDTPAVVPVGDPHPGDFRGQAAYYDLEYIDLLADYENKLIVDWGSATRMWHQKGTTEKPIIAIQADEKKVFSGFDNLILTFDELKNVIENAASMYEAWKVALSAINAIYLIVDRSTGDRYIGSAYGTDGLWGRWSVYVATGGHGNNKRMVKALEEDPTRCHQLQFSVLQILSKTIPEDRIVDIEAMWKKKLLTKDFGWNDN